MKEYRLQLAWFFSSMGIGWEALKFHCGFTMHIILARTDNIGDMLLSFPLAVRLKQFYPGLKISILAREYVRALVDACPDIDQFLSYEQLLESGEIGALQTLKQQNAQSILLMHPQPIIQQWLKQLAIPHKITNLHKYFYYSSKKWNWKILNINYGSKNKPLHFAQRCMLFLKAFGLPGAVTRKELIDLIHLRIEPSEKIKAYLSPNHFNLLIHPGTNNNTIEWPKKHVETLLRTLPQTVKVLLTGSEQEAEKFSSLLNCRPGTEILFGKLTLTELFYLLQQVDGVLANGTGPLHIAAALGTQTLGLYPAQATINSLRWGPIGRNTATLEAPHCSLSLQKKRCNCMEKLLPEQVLLYIEKHWL